MVVSRGSAGALWADASSMAMWQPPQLLRLSQCLFVAAFRASSDSASFVPGLWDAVKPKNAAHHCRTAVVSTASSHLLKAAQKARFVPGGPRPCRA